MMYANNPYQKTDDGIGSGFMAGAAIGGAAAYGANRALKAHRMAQLTGVRGSLNDIRNARDSIYRDAASSAGRDPLGSIMKVQGAANFSGAAQASVRSGASGHISQKLFGGKKYGWGNFKMGKRSAITAGASILGGAILGSAMDAMND